MEGLVVTARDLHTTTRLDSGGPRRLWVDQRELFWLPSPCCVPVGVPARLGVKEDK